jgi:hypothetical protein
MRLRAYISSKQKGAERFSTAFAPKTCWGLFLRNQVIKTCAIPGLARLTFGRDIVDTCNFPITAGRPPPRRLGRCGLFDTDRETRMAGFRP